MIFQQQFPDFHLEDKVSLEEESSHQSFGYIVEEEIRGAHELWGVWLLELGPTVSWREERFK